MVAQKRLDEQEPVPWLMTLGERQTETKTFGEVVDFDKRLVNAQ